MARATDAESAPRGGEESYVDPRAPRFGQTLTATGLLVGVILDVPALVYAVTAVLVLAVVAGWELDAWAALWRHGALRLLDAPEDREPAAPHRFAKLIGATGTTLSSALLLAGAPLAGYAVALAVAAAAALSAATGICLGCRMYRQVAFFRRLDVV